MESIIALVLLAGATGIIAMIVAALAKYLRS